MSKILNPTRRAALIILMLCATAYSTSLNSSAPALLQCKVVRPNVCRLDFSGNYTGDVQFPSAGMSGTGTMVIRGSEVRLTQGATTLSGTIDTQYNERTYRSYGTIRIQNKTINLRPYRDPCDSNRIKLINIAQGNSNKFRFCSLSPTECLGKPNVRQCG